MLKARPRVCAEGSLLSKNNKLHRSCQQVLFLYAEKILFRSKGIALLCAYYLSTITLRTVLLFPISNRQR